MHLTLEVCQLYFRTQGFKIKPFPAETLHVAKCLVSCSNVRQQRQVSMSGPIHQESFVLNSNGVIIICKFCQPKVKESGRCQLTDTLLQRGFYTSIYIYTSEQFRIKSLAWRSWDLKSQLANGFPWSYITMVGRLSEEDQLSRYFDVFTCQPKMPYQCLVMIACHVKYTQKFLPQTTWMMEAQNGVECLYVIALQIPLNRSKRCNLVPA